jgi:phage-related protein
MDVLEQFLHNISYKFPKGYPDLTNKNDLALLENEFKKIGIDLSELEINSPHWSERVNERGAILNILNFPEDSPISKQDVIDQIQNELTARTSRLEKLSEFPISVKYKIGYKLMKPILKYDGNNIPLKLKVEYTTKDAKKTGIGISYVAIIADNKLITLMLLPEDNNAEIELAMEKHQQRKEYEKSPRVLTASNYEFFITPKTETTKTLIDPATLPYSIKTSYRVGSNFTHKDYGTGKIVAAASSGTRSGEPDSRGIVEWVEVDFGKPYVTGGQLKKTRIIKNVYASLSPDLGIAAAAE